MMKLNFSAAIRALAGALMASFVIAGPAQAQGLTLNIHDRVIIEDNEKSYDPSPAGGTIKYTVNIQNGGNIRTAPDVIVFAIPAGTTFAGITGIAGCTPEPEFAGPSDLICPVPSLAPREGVSAELSIIADSAGVVSLAGQIGDGPVVSESTTVTQGADIGLSFSGPSDVQAGEFLTFSATISNAGPDASEAADFTMSLPSVLSPDVILPAGCSISGSDVSCRLAQIPVNGSVELEFTTQVLTANDSNVSVAGSISAAAPDDPNGANNADAFNISIKPGTDVVLQKTRSPSGLLYLGQPVTFTLTPGFVGDVPLDAVIEDVLPSNYEFTSVTAAGDGWSCPNTHPVMCSYSADTADEAGFRAPITIEALPVAETDPDTRVENIATIASSTDVNPDNNTASDGGADIQAPVIDLAAHKTAPRLGLVTVGNEYDWQIWTSNGGNAGFFGRLEMIERVPAGLEVTDISTPTGWSCDFAPPVAGPADILCHSDNYTAANPLGVGQQTPALTVTTRVTQEGELTNGLVVGSPDPNYPDRDQGNNEITSGVTSAEGPQVADLSISKRVISAGPYVSGDPVTFEVEIVNSGVATAQDVRLVDRLNDLYFEDDTTTAVTMGTVPDGMSCTPVRGGGFYTDLTCSIDALPQCTANSDCPVVTFTALAGGDGAKRNVAETYSVTTPDPDFANNTASADYTVEPRTDVTVEKTASQVNDGSVLAGQELIYVLTAIVPGNGLSGAENVTVTDSLPAGLRILRVEPDSGSCGPVSALDAAGITTAGSELVCNLGSIGNGRSQSVRVFTVPSTEIAGTTITNNVAISTTTAEIEPGNNSDVIRHQVTRPSLDLVTNKVDSVDPLEIGNQTTYTVTVRNVGPSEAFNLQITDTLPARGMRLDAYAAQTDGMACGLDGASLGGIGGQLTCELANLPVGAKATLEVTMTGVERGRWTNRVEVRSDEYGDETQTANNDVEQATSVFERADLEVVKTPSKAQVDLLERFDWTIAVQNIAKDGIGLAENVVLRDTLPVDMEIAGTVTVPAGVSCDAPVGSRDLVCILPDMQSGDRHEITVPVKVTRVTANPQRFANTASVTTDSFDVDGTNNSATGTVEVRATSVSGSVWRDFNEDEIADANDSGISGIVVQLSGTDLWGNPVDARSLTTDASGDYSFGLLPPGSYQVSYVSPSGDTYLPGAALPRGVGGGSASGVTAITDVTATTADPATEKDFTLIPQARIALAKQLAVPALQSDGSWLLTYDFRIRNDSQEPVGSFTLTDTLITDFGTYVSDPPGPGQFAIESVTNGALASVNDGQIVLTSPAQLGQGSTRRITLILRVNPALPRSAPTQEYRNSAEVEGQGVWSGQTPDDGSNDGATPTRGETSDTVRTVDFVPAIALEKTATLEQAGAVAAPGDTIRYGFTVRNTGRTPLLDVDIEDPLSDLVWDSKAPFVRLNPGAEDATSFVAHYVLTQDDIEAGSVPNTATATGRWADDGVTNPTVSAEDSAEIVALAQPALTVVKAVTADTVQNPTQVGDTIDYSFTVTNTGNVALKDLVLTDQMLGLQGAEAIPVGTLAPAGQPGDSATVTAVHRVTQDDIDRGKVVNIASVEGTHGPDDEPVDPVPSNEVTTPLFPEPQMRVTKTATTVPEPPRAGDDIIWTIAIENTGNTRLDLTGIDEPLADTTLSAPGKSVLEPGESTTATATHRLTQAEIDAGEVANQVTVSGRVPNSDVPVDDTPSGNDPDTPNEEPTVTPLTATPSVALLKELVTDVTQPLMPGDEIDFRFTVRNTGNVTLKDLVLTDPLPGVALDTAPLEGLNLAPDDTVVVTGAYALTPADIEAGGLTNTATVTARDPNETPVEDDSGTGFENDDPTPVTLVREPAISLVKTISTAPAAPVQAGDVIEYAFAVHNTGNVELRDVMLNELVAGVDFAGSRAAPLAVGGVDSTSFTARHVLTQADIDAGVFANEARADAVGNGPDGPDHPVSDLSGTDMTNDDPTVFAIDPDPALTIVKTADADGVTDPTQPGDTITYAFTVTNTGNVTLTGVTVDDPLPGLEFDAGNTIPSLAPGAEAVLTASYQVVLDDIHAGEVVNKASVTGDRVEGGTPVTTPPVDSDEVTVPLHPVPAIDLVKTITSALPETVQAGEEITYGFTVTNIGNTELTGVTVEELLTGATVQGGPITLAPGESDSTSFTASYLLTQADIERGHLENQALASGIATGSGQPVEDRSGTETGTDQPTRVELGQFPGITLTKTAATDRFADPDAPVAGDVIRYGFVVENTGNVVLHDVVLSDPGLVFDDPAPAPFDLAPGERRQLDDLGGHALTQADIDAGIYPNTATATGGWGDDGSGNRTPIAAEASADVPLAARPAIDLVKVIDLPNSQLSAPVRAGDVVHYGFTVTNTGNVTLTDIELTDMLPGIALSGSLALLEPGTADSTSFSATYVLTQADIDSGEIVNQATVAATGGRDLSGTPQRVTDVSGTSAGGDDPTVLPIEPVASLSLVKTPDIAALGSPPQRGDIVSYSFVITNTGNVTLTDVTLTDPLPVTLPVSVIAVLEPGAGNAVTLTGSYELTQEDLDAGIIENTAQVDGGFVHPLTGDRIPAEPATDTAIVEMERAPGLALLKTADESGISEVAQVGEEVVYTFAVTNTGNVTLTDITVDDPLPGLVLSGAPIASLLPGETSTAITGSYALTIEDIRAAELVNTATATGEWQQGSGGPPEPVTSEPSAVTVELGYPEIDLNITVDRLRDLNGDGVMGPDDQVTFRFEVINLGTVPLHDVNIVPESLSLALPGLSCAPISLDVGARAFLECSDAPYSITPRDAERGEISLEGSATGTSDAGVTVSATSLATTVANVAQGGLTLEKLAGIETAMIGDIVPYEIRVTNSADGVRVTARLQDTLPAGFAYVADSARLDGDAVALAESGRRIALEPVDVEPGQTRVLTLRARVGSSVKPGAHVNRARLLSSTTGRDIAEEATATVRVLADAVMQCATVLGRVFDDRDQNGHMSRSTEERGLPNVRLVAPNGLAINTDQHGRFNVPCAALPQAIGSNFMLKLDERTLPAGYRLTTENPRVVRLTPGMITRLDFGATMARLVRVDLAANAFDGAAMGGPLDAGLRRMVAEIRDTVTMLRITYLLAPDEPEQNGRTRLRQVERAVRDLWRDEGRYKLNIETLVQRAGEAK